MFGWSITIKITWSVLSCATAFAYSESKVSIVDSSPSPPSPLSVVTYTHCCCPSSPLDTNNALPPMSAFDTLKTNKQCYLLLSPFCFLNKINSCASVTNPIKLFFCSYWYTESQNMSLVYLIFYHLTLVEYLRHVEFPCLM